jgi:hypothetical protein
MMPKFLKLNKPWMYYTIGKNYQRSGMNDNMGIDYLSILEGFVFAGEGGLNGLGCRVNITGTL